MSVKQVVQQQRQRIVDQNYPMNFPSPPKGEWLKTVRQALGMSGAQLAKRLRASRGRVAQAELAEQGGVATLNSMSKMAEAMGCRFVYAIVPPHKVETLILTQARKKAAAIVAIASKHMALENQALPKEKIEEQIEYVARQIIAEHPSSIWDDR